MTILKSSKSCSDNFEKQILKAAGQGLKEPKQNEEHLNIRMKKSEVLQKCRATDFWLRGFR